MATANEKLSDESLAHAIWVSQYSTGVANRMIKILNDSDAELTARLLVAMDTLDAESFTVSRLESKPMDCGSRGAGTFFHEPDRRSQEAHRT